MSETSLPVPAPEAPPIIERDVTFDKPMFNRWCAMQIKASLAGRVLEAPPGKVLRTADGMVYIADLHGTLHVARDEDGKKMKPPNARGRRWWKRIEANAKALSVPEAPEGDSRVAAPPAFVSPGATWTVAGAQVEAETPESGKVE